MMTVQLRKITVSLPSHLLEYADRRASQSQVSRSQVISAALADAEAQELARLAAEGYRFYAGEALEFAEASARATAESFGVASEGDADGRQTW